MAKTARPKTDASDGHVPLHSILAQHLQEWKARTPRKDTDFVFPSLKAEGRVPRSPSAFVADHLRPAEKKAGVQVEDGQRFGVSQQHLDYGVFNLKLSHNTNIRSRTYRQNTFMTQLHWGQAKKYVAKRDLLRRTLYLYRKDTSPPEFMIEID